MKFPLILLPASLYLLFLSGCGHSSKPASVRNAPQSGLQAQLRDHVNSSATDSIPPPAGMTRLGAATGDLDKDGTAEQVVVYDTKKETDMGTERQICIYKQAGGHWTLWHRSVGAVLPSEHGGPMGDPFVEVAVRNGCIVIDHNGGGIDKWNYTHTYRYQNNNWYLIGATVLVGTNCRYWNRYDYNLSTGKIAVSLETESCDEAGDNQKTTKKEEFVFTRQLPVLPLMDGFYPGDNKVAVPGKEEAFYY